MAPDGSETCIAFVDVPSDIQVDETHRTYNILNVRFRVVVWFDERKIDFEGENDKPGRLVQEIINTVKGLNNVWKKQQLLNWLILQTLLNILVCLMWLTVSMVTLKPH